MSAFAVSAEVPRRVDGHLVLLAERGPELRVELFLEPCRAGSGFVFRRNNTSLVSMLPEPSQSTTTRGCSVALFTTTRSGRRKRKGHGERNEETQGMEGGHPAAAAFAAPAAEENHADAMTNVHGDGDDPGSGIELPAFDHERD